MDDMKRQEWSRHYDTIHWNAMTFFATGAAALLGYVLGKHETQPIDFWIGLFGLWTTNMPVYYTAGYRELRNQLLLDITDEATAQFLTNKGRSHRFSMWPAYIITFWFLDLLWSRFFWRVSPIFSVFVAVVSSVFLYVAYKRCRSVSYKEWAAHHKPGTAP